MSVKKALNGLVDRMFRHADLDEALGIDDLTKLERGIPLGDATGTGSMPAPDWSQETVDLPEALGPARPAAEPIVERAFLSEVPSLSGDSWLSKGWTVAEDRPEATIAGERPSGTIGATRDPHADAAETRDPLASFEDPDAELASVDELRDPLASLAETRDPLTSPGGTRDPLTSVVEGIDSDASIDLAAGVETKTGILPAEDAAPLRLSPLSADPPPEYDLFADLEASMIEYAIADGASLLDTGSPRPPVRPTEDITVPPGGLVTGADWG